MIDTKPAPTSMHPPACVLAVALRHTDMPALGQLLTRMRPEQDLGLLLLPVDAEAFTACVECARTAIGVLTHVVAADRMPLLADRLHIVPAGQVVSVEEGRLIVGRPQDGEAGAIDRTLRGLAESHGDRAIGVLLANAAPAAFGGAMALREAGGLLIVQDEEVDRGLPARPEVALVADFLLESGLLAKRVYEYLAYRMEASSPRLADGEELARIIRLIERASGVDFSDYKKSTLQRRILRRTNLNQLPDATAYIDLLESSPTEASTLYREMLIGVTRFFRDPESFAVLAEAVLKPLFATPARKDPVRIWVAGCATGEEAYSIAILIREAMATSGVLIPVKIFATDLDREAVEFASTGTYPAAIGSDVSAERLARFFTRHGDSYQVTKKVREMVVFAHHNILRDPPFFRMDLVTCRNLLIYLQPVLQRRLFSAFHFALGAEGHLLLGTSETLGEMAQYFTPIDAKWKLYRKKGDRLPRISDTMFPDIIPQRARPPQQSPAEVSPASADSLHDAIQQTLFREFMPAFLIADEQFDIHYTSGSIERFLTLPRGKPSFSLAKMAGPELGVALTTGIRRALRDNCEVVFDQIAVGQGPQYARVRVAIRPFLQRSDVRHLAVVVFEEPEGAAERPNGEAFDLSAQTDQRIKDLEAELEQTKESLQAAIEELETSNEELQATNEELLAANEELQSTNEELQSVNEELYTVNAEYQSKISELTELNNDIINLLGATNIGTIFLDQQLCVRKFTRAATAHINLIDKDIGRPLSHISNNIDYVNLVGDAEEVLQTLVPKQRRVCTRNGRWHQMRLLPYRTEDNVIKGVIITFIDISEIEVADGMFRKLATAMENTVSIAMITNAQGDIDYVNQRFVEVTGWQTHDVVGRNPRLLRQQDVAAGELAGLRAALANGQVWSGRLRNQRREGERFVEDAVIMPLRNSTGAIAGHLKVATVVATP
jgi:two-component system CheB/CheR fusion protein